MINLKKFIKYKPENQNEWKVYFLLYRKKIVYIGCTNNISKRLQFHSNYYDPYGVSFRKGYLGKKKFTSYRYIVIKDKKKAYRLENKLIKKYMPLYNNNKNYFSTKHYEKNAPAVEPGAAIWQPKDVKCCSREFSNARTKSERALPRDRGR